MLKHPSGGFVSHMEWNSMPGCGAAFLWWPIFEEHQTHCWFACTTWGLGLDINGDVKRELKSEAW